MLFDLDGTVSDGASGMFASLAHACTALGLEVPAVATLRRFIGPPLTDAFAEHFNLDAAACEAAVAAYRQHYVETGAMLSAEAFPGVPELLEQLVGAGFRLAIATSKPEVQAEQIVEHLGVAPWFSAVCGADLEGRRVRKADVIARACQRLRLSSTETVMVGDREHDVLGARAHRISCIGVLWGFGERAELEAARAAAVVEAPHELARLLLGEHETPR